MNDNSSPDPLVKRISWLWFVLGGIALFLASVLAVKPEDLAGTIVLVIVFGGIFGISVWRVIRAITYRKRKRPARKMGARFLSGCLTVIAVFSVIISGFAIMMIWIIPPDRDMKEAAKPVIEALNAYHNRTGRYPENLSDLVPEYLSAVPGCKPGKAQPRMYYRLSPEYGEYTLLCHKFAYERQRYNSRTKEWDTFD